MNIELSETDKDTDKQERRERRERIKGPDTTGSMRGVFIFVFYIFVFW
jgi:hypothetical protein